jgi:D-alanyl-D-alanine carboxypeptidase/D-alanyl-D-alanine carboxypeptidase (penicillin-binding protein 5/6)
MDAKTGQILSEKNSQTQAPPASTTKVMTAIIALENGDLERKLVASFSAVKDIGKDGMNIGIVQGEELTLKDLLNALLVRSANETANIISENLAPNKSEFMKYLNRRAKEIGAKNTFFVNPCGKDSEDDDINHLSTAYDLATMAKHALTFPVFREIVAKKMCTIPPTNKFDKPRYLATTNKLLGEGYNSTYYSKINGIKTGFTDKAGSNLITSASDKNGNELIVVIMGYRNGVIFEFAKELLEYGFKDFTYTDIVEKNTIQKSIFISQYPDQQIQLLSGNNLKIILPKNPEIKWNVEKKEYLNPIPETPIKIGDNLGHIEYFVNDLPVGIVNLISNTNVIPNSISSKYLKGIDFKMIFKYLIYIVLGVFAGFVLFILFLIFSKKLRKYKFRIKKKKRKTKHCHKHSHNFKYFKKYN